MDLLHPAGLIQLNNLDRFGIPEVCLRGIIKGNMTVFAHAEHTHVDGMGSQKRCVPFTFFQQVIRGTVQPLVLRRRTWC